MLSEVFAGQVVYSRRNARAVLLQKASNDVRAVCFARLFLDRGDHATMLHCAELGCALAQAFLAEMSVGKERFHWASLAAAQGERDGFYWLGTCYRIGAGCVKDAEKEKENFLAASNLGHIMGTSGSFWKASRNKSACC